MFSSNNHNGSGGSKGKRLSSFFQFGSNSNTGNLASRSTVTKNDNGGNIEISVRPNEHKASMKKGEDKKLTSGKRNPFVPSSKLTTVATDVKSKHSSSHLISRGTSSNKDNLPLRGTSGKTEGSSDRHTSQRGSHHSHKHATNSNDVRKKKTPLSLASKEDEETSSSSSSSKHDSNGPSKRTSSLGRRPPPPVDLSVLRNSMKRLSQDKKENMGPNVNSEWPIKDLTVSENDCLEGSLRSVVLREDTAGNSGSEFNLRQHKKEVSEAEKFEEELDSLIKEHNTVEDIHTIQQEGFPGKASDREMDVQGALNTNLDFAGNSNDGDESPFSYVDPLKISERPQYGKLPTVHLSKASSTEPSDTYTMHSSSYPELNLPLSNSLQTSRSEPLLNPPPISSSVPSSIPIPGLSSVSSQTSSSKIPVESSSFLQSSTPTPLEVEKYKSGTSDSTFGTTSFTSDEHVEGFSFTKSSSDSLQDIRQRPLDNTRDASSIASTLYHRHSSDFSTSGSGNETPPNVVSAGLHVSPSTNDCSGGHDEKDRSKNYEDVDELISRDPFLDSSVMEQVANADQPKTIDSDDGSSGKVFDRISGAQSLDTEVLMPPRRKFRVVNEDRPTFCMDDFDGSLNDNTEYDDIARNHYNVNNKGLSIKASERTSTVNPVRLNNQNLGSATPSAGMRLGFASLDSSVSEEDDISKNAGNFSKAKEGLLTLGHNNLYSRQSLRSNQSNGSSSSTNSSGSVRHDKSVILVSSYVEELRLKYYRSSNFLQAPPNLPITLKQKNNMVLSKNVKVRIRTSSKQIGIKHGGAKQKLLTLETAHEDIGEDGSIKTPNNKNRINVNHTREFQNLLNQKGPSRAPTPVGSPPKFWNKDDDTEEFMNDIPGDEAYDSDDAMAPLRKEVEVTGVTRSSTVKSYFTKQQERLQDINNALKYEKLPSNININDYVSSTQLSKIISSGSGDSGVNESFSYGQGLRVANPDSSHG